MKPENDEYNPYYKLYIEKVQEDNPISALESCFSDAMEFWGSLTDNFAGKPYGENKWSYKETFGHIIDTERIMAYRALCIARGESKSLPGFDQNMYVKVGNFNRREIKDMIEEYFLVRKSSLILFNSFTEEDFTKRGTANENEITVLALAFIIAGHDKHHLGLLKEYYQRNL
jgi:hypothetical protein